MYVTADERYLDCNIQALLNADVQRERERERETRATLVSEGSPSSVSARNDITVIDHASAAVVNA